MSNLKRFNKLYISLLTMIVSIILGSSAVNAVYFTGWQKGSNQLWTSKEFYCLEHQDYFSAGNWNPAYSWTVTTNDEKHEDRILANILYNGIKTGQGGYNQRGEYQMAIWKWSYVYGHGNTVNVSSPRFDLAYNETINRIPYVNEGNAAISIADSQVSMEGNIGSFKINDISGQVSKVDIVWKDTKNKEHTKTITAGKSGESGWVTFYSDKACTKPINVNDFKKGNVYIKNLKTDYEVKDINITVKSNASGYAVTVTRWKKDTGVSSQQDLISATMREGTPSEVPVHLKVKYLYGNLRILKKGVYKINGKAKEQKISASFKIYSPSINKWVAGDANGNKTFVDNIDKATTYKSGTTVKRLSSSYKYQLVEVAVNNNYYNNPIKMVAVSSDLQKGLKVTKKDTYYASSSVIVYSNKTNTVTVLDERTAGELKIIKADSRHKDLVLQGAKFKVYSKEGWLIKNSDGTYKYNGDVKSATEFISDAKGEVQLKNLKLGTYYIYETTTPEGYDLTKQPGYENKNGKDPYSHSKDNKWAYLGEAKLDANNISVKYTYTNEKIVARLEGRVWVDWPDKKANGYDDIYNPETDDELLNGIKVYLKDGDKVIAETVTGKDKDGKDGWYAFENLNYWDVARYHVEFAYNNQKYVILTPFAGNSLKVNSKAMEESMKAEELEDDKLTGEDGALPGRAVTYKGGKLLTPQQILDNNKAQNKDLMKTPLTGYYNTKTFTIEDINLGMKEKIDPGYEITETLEYIKVNVNGYSYKYQHGQDPVTMSNYVPKTATQNSAATFSQALYPSDIRYLQEKGSGVDVYVVYGITVSNNETTFIDDIYTEKKLYLNSLENKFDGNRYELCKDKNNSDSSEFALWDIKDGKAVYNLDHNNSAFKDGIAKGDCATTRIQFRIKDEHLKNMLAHNDDAKKGLEEAPTVAKASAFHEYLRTDHVWNDDANVKAYNGVKGKYEEKNKDNKKYYVHKSVTKEKTGSDLFINLTLGNNRILSGTVFEDNAIINENDKTYMGDGILEENNEKNRAKDVKVELLNADNKKSIAKLYQVDRISDYAVNLKEIIDAEVKTGQDGKFTFDGVVPGYYYIRFTYGDGTQKMVDTNGNEVEITSKDYKSTIVSNDNIKNSMKADEKAINNACEVLLKDYNSEESKSAKQLVEWYKYLDKVYSTAVDDLSDGGARKSVSNLTYSSDGTVTDGSESATDINNIPAITPIIGISIENDTENIGTSENKNEYNGFNFGIIKQPNTVVNLGKKITNVKFTNQAGTTLVSDNPASRQSTYVKALDKIVDRSGSKDALMEIDPEHIYGSNIEITYEVRLENDSYKDYTEDSYYKFGENGNTKKEVTILSVQDMLDEKYNYGSLPKTTIQENSESTISTPITLTPKAGATEGEPNYVEMTGWAKLASDETTKTSYTVTALVSNSDDTDTDYHNDAKIRTLSVDKLSTFTTASEKTWESDSTVFTITPTTGKNKDNTYIYIGAVALAVLASGIFLIKKRVLSK